MLLDDNKAELLKRWITNKLESASEADSDVLADYVLALVRTDEPEAVAKSGAIESLKDFLGDNATSFVEDVFTAIKTQVYDPNRPKPKAPTLRKQPNNASRKRPYQQIDVDDAQNLSVHASRPLKLPRNGARGGRTGGRGASHQTQSHNSNMSFPNFPLALDPNDPFAAFLAMHQAMGLPLPDLNNLPGASNHNQFTNRQPCREYDTNGFCTAGASCPYEHDFTPNVAVANTTWNDLSELEPALEASRHAPQRRQGQRGRGTNRSHRHGRAEFSELGPYTSESNKSIVVEQIPEEHRTETAVRDYFAAFGEIEQLHLQPHRRLAVITFTTPEAARAAYRSPKAIFDNRFVKVYWYRLEGDGGPTEFINTLDDGEAGGSSSNLFETDPEEFEKRQREAQRRLEENRIMREEAEKRKSEIDARLQAIDQEQQTLKSILVTKYGLEEFDKEEKGESDHAKALKAQLAELEAEAVSLGLDPNVPSHGQEQYSDYRPRGGYRGGRGRGGRGGWRGGHVRHWQPGWDRPRRHLDNRPKALTVVFRDGSYGSYEEQLRQYLFFGAESSTLMEHPEHAGAALVSFKEREQAEMFIDAANKQLIGNVGKLDLAWYPGPESNGVEVGPSIKEEEGPADDMAEAMRALDRDLDEYGDEEEGEIL